MSDSCRCGKPHELCVCQSVTPLENSRFVFILQHPQECEEPLGSAVIVNCLLKNSRLKTALSLPNLKKELGEDVQPSRWLVLYPGSKYRLRELHERDNTKILRVLDKSGNEIDWDPGQFDGVVALDGTWPQTKALWWRNPWLLKLRRAVILPPRPSLYGNLRKEPRREGLSTLEAIAYTLEALGEDPSIGKTLLDRFRHLIERYRNWKKNAAAIKPEAEGPG